MALKFGEAVTMIVERYGWSAFDNLSAINDPDLGKAVEMVRKVRKKKDDIHANKPGVDLRRTRPPRKKIEKMASLTTSLARGRLKRLRLRALTKWHESESNKKSRSLRPTLYDMAI